MMSEFKCRVCGKTGRIAKTNTVQASECECVFTLFSWEVPLAADVRDTFMESKKYPLEVVLCGSCGHVQLKNVLDVNLYDNYLYTPSFSGTFRAYIEKFADDLSKRMGNADKKSVVEIGSSNGFLLQKFQERGWEVLGFEPSVRRAFHPNSIDEYRCMPWITGFCTF